MIKVVQLIKTKLCSQNCRKWKEMFKGSIMVQIYIKWTSFDFDSEVFKQSATENHNPLCCWLIINNLISKICPKFQILKSHFFEVKDLLGELWWENERRENISNLCRM